jgi:hypothetical protein
MASGTSSIAHVVRPPAPGTSDMAAVLDVSADGSKLESAGLPHRWSSMAEATPGGPASGPGIGSMHKRMIGGTQDLLP